MVVVDRVPALTAGDGLRRCRLPSRYQYVGSRQHQIATIDSRGSSWPRSMRASFDLGTPIRSATSVRLKPARLRRATRSSHQLPRRTLQVQEPRQVGILQRQLVDQLIRPRTPPHYFATAFLRKTLVDTLPRRRFTASLSRSTKMIESHDLHWCTGHACYGSDTRAPRSPGLARCL